MIVTRFFVGSGLTAIRGGNWNNGASAGVFALYLNNAPSNSNNNIGFRLGNSRFLSGLILGRVMSAQLCHVTWSSDPACVRLPARRIHEQAGASQ